jgi:sialate O-acetylesterase
MLFWTLVALLCGSATGLYALELNRSFSDNMVLQRDKPLTVWGKTQAGGQLVTVTFADQSTHATSDYEGHWSVSLKPFKAESKPRTLEVKGEGQSIALKNVLVGDVFLFARQSSVDVSLGRSEDGRNAAGALDQHKNYRFIKIKASPSQRPMENLKEDATTGWQEVNGKSALTMSAAAFYLGRDLAENVDVPIGMIDLDMGYHFSGAWLSDEGLDKAQTREGPLQSERAYLPKDIVAWNNRTEGYKHGKLRVSVSEEYHPGLAPVERPHAPGVCYNAVIHPLRGLVVKGMLLQLGNNYPFVGYSAERQEAGKFNAGAVNTISYLTLKGGRQMIPQVLPEAPDDLRRSLGEAHLPIAWIMPPGSDNYAYASQNRDTRELQRRSADKCEGIDLILPGAEHVNMSGQPADEALLAQRCRQWVMSSFYGAEGPVTGPIFDRVEIDHGAATIHFKAGSAEGLTATGDGLNQFELGGDDEELIPCRVRIDGETIKLEWAKASVPMFIRYDWNHKPVQGLVNSAGLPAIPFTTDERWEYNWWPDPAPIPLPAEYHTPANKWPKRDYAVINFNTEGSGLHLGPTGLWGTPAGPNIHVANITEGSPADGKVLVGDMIYGVNGNEFGSEPDDKYVQFADAITLAETDAGAGRMILNISRDRKLLEVPIQLEVMGSFSATSPWNCEKSRRIVEKAEDYMRKGMRPGTGVPNDDDYAYGPWNDNVIFLMAAGNPEMQGLVRRYIRQKIDEVEAWAAGDKAAYKTHGGWGNAYLSMLFGEYYHRTGDPSVLPALEQLVYQHQKGHIEMLEANPGNWPPTGPSGYGTHPAAQMPDAMGAVLARQAGVKVNEDVLNFDLDHLHRKRAENGWILYNGYGPFLVTSRQVDEPPAIDPDAQAAGLLSSMNGKLGTGAALFSLVEGYDKAVYECSTRCVSAYNKTRTGHGGAWFNNFWTPIGAYHAGKENYQHFMKGQQWWRELYRDHSGAVWQHHNAKEKKSVLATGFVTHRVAHLKKLRILGAPRSAFGVNPPAYLKDALGAHRQRNYSLAAELIEKELAKGKIPEHELPMVRHFLDSVETLQKSIDYDLAYTQDLIRKGELYLASIEYPQLKMVVAPDNAQLQAIAAAVEGDEAQEKIAAALKVAKDIEERERKRIAEQKAAAAEARSASDTWTDNQERLITFIKDGKATFESIKRRKGGMELFPEVQWTPWRISVLEAPEHTPEEWMKPGFDDSSWRETKLPTVWHPGHTGLLRTTFNVQNKDAIDGLQVRAITYKLKDMKIYLNGELVAHINGMDKQHCFPLPDYALSQLKNGVNHLAVYADHGARYVDFSFRLEGRLKSTASASD